MALLVAQSQQKSPTLAIIRNLNAEPAEIVQQYEQTSSRKSSGVRSRTSEFRARPAAPAARQAPSPPKIERRRFNVLLRTAGGFDETGE